MMEPCRRYEGHKRKPGAQVWRTPRRMYRLGEPYATCIVMVTVGIIHYLLQSIAIVPTICVISYGGGMGLPP
jgi:hypothetical protein